MGRPLAVRLKEHKYNLMEALCDKSKIVARAFEEWIDWDQTHVLQTESNSVFRKYKQSAHTICSNNPISQASLFHPCTRHS
jgi:hypothetical protein